MSSPRHRDGAIDFARVYDIHTQARAKLFDWIRPLSHEQYTLEFPFAHRTIRATLHEVATTEWWLTARLREEPMPRPFSWADLPMNRHATFAELEPAWTEQAPRTSATLAELTDLDEIVETRMYGRRRVRILRATKRTIATQVLLHEVHHRAQAMAMLRHLGIEAQDLDYIYFLQEERVEAISQ